MPTPTYDLIASNVLSSSASSVTFSSIPATYRDLVLVIDWLGSGGNAWAEMRFNNDNGSNYSFVEIAGNGTNATTNSGNDNKITAETFATTTSKALVTFQIMDYATTNKHKSVLTRANRGDNSVRARANRWASTSAINSIVVNASGNYASGSTFYLYGIVS